MAKVALISGESIARYGFANGHPFGPDRHDAFMQELRASGVDARVHHLEPRVATYDELHSFHTARYIDFVKTQCATGLGFLDGGDTPAQRGMYEAAANVVGATMIAVEAIMSGKARRGFVPIAGLHHAGRDNAAGFCIFNDCGVAVEQLRSRYQLNRVAYVDIDAHHGDGVYYGFVDDPYLAFADIHEDGKSLYPGTGASTEQGTGKGKGAKLNLPLPAGASDEEFLIAWSKALAHIEAAQSDFIILQCGADSIAGDPITHLQLSPAMHAMAAHDLCALAEKQGHGRVLGLGGGGYNRRNLAITWTGVVKALVEA